jgi:hypothetical protein
MGWKVVGVFKDQGRSGYSGEFWLGLQDLLRFLSKGRRPGADRSTP